MPVRSTIAGRISSNASVAVQSAISPSSRAQAILLFTGDTGECYEYRDDFYAAVDSSRLKSEPSRGDCSPWKRSLAPKKFTDRVQF